MNFKISRHAHDEMKQRRIPSSLVEDVLENPQQVVEEYGNKKGYQSKIDFGGGRIYLLRVIVNDTVDPAVVVTIYKTSKIQKYWREK